MGVQGWSLLLSEEGWIPLTKKKNEEDDKTSLWMSPEVVQKGHDLLEERLVEIRRGAELHIDGFCLCFHIHTVAYARHCRQVLLQAESSKKKQKPNPSKWKPAQVRHMIPSFLPCELLTQVTQEFIGALTRKKCQLKLRVYWDGDGRYAPPAPASDDPNTDDGSDEEEEEEGPASFKHETELFRQFQRMEEWSVFQDYCLHGKIPTDIALHRWERAFPKNRLFIGQVMHALWKLNTPMEFCQEEADSVMARAVRGKPNAFVVGLDTDFCFFPQASYIPINTLMRDTSDGAALKAIVMRREALADSLDITDEAMVELAILMGNDYVSGTERYDLPINNNDDGSDLPARSHFTSKKFSIRSEAFLQLLRHQGEGYRVESSDQQIQGCLEFVRKLYNLQDMSDYTMEVVEGGNEPSLIPAAVGMTDELSSQLKRATIDPKKGDKSLQDAVVRYLNMIIQHQQESKAVLLAEDGTVLPKVLTPTHVQAFAMLSPQRPSFADIDMEIKNAAWRPLWRDVPAVYWIERIINAIMNNAIGKQHTNKKPKVDGLVAPGEAFDPYLYHSYLRAAREAHGVTEETNPAVASDVVPELTPETNETTEAPRLKLPVDEFRDTILQSVQKNRVTIIQGDTGCGKSSRIPVMLLNAPSPNPNQTQTKLFISQPRRIAAKALVERLRSVEPDLKDQIGLRMGHGVREYETNKTRAWFVTTGYLVRLLANHPERFDDISVLIVDEVHERSVDTDILCLLCRRLLVTNQNIRLVLMSATLAADMYQAYFDVTEPPIRVGARRFPVKEVFLDDLKKEVRLSSNLSRKTTELLADCAGMKCRKAPSLQFMEKLYSVVANLATVIGQPGSSVLIFVPGMNEIVAITEVIESIAIPGVRFTCIPIHSDIPFEDQMTVFDASADDEVKIVIATNAAESSLTLPEVDNVICLGLCKQIIYNEASHRQMLTPTWISRASATQRAGRTGRVRPGTVYRMYSRQNYEFDMDAFEPGEMLRIPLDSVILMLKEMLSEEQVSEVLLTCLEPPDISAIDRSFKSLHKSHFISAPDDSCELTNLGSFVSSLGIDLALGSLIGLGIQMGVGAEAIQMAAILSFPKSPWIMSNPLIHPTASFNENTCKSYISRCHFDANTFSEPLAVMNLLWDYEHLEGQKATQKWGRVHNVFLPRIRRLSSTTVNLRKRVADFLGIAEGVLRVERPPLQMPHGMITMLRVIQVWVFHETMIQFDQKSLQNIQKKYNKVGVSLDIQQQSDTIEQRHLEQILLKDRHAFTLKGSCEIRQKGSFEYIRVTSSGTFDAGLEAHLLSYATVKELGFVCIAFQDTLSIYTVNDSVTENALVPCLLAHRKADSKVQLVALSNEGKSLRGIGERSCGMWDIQNPSKKGDGNNEKAAVPWARYRYDLPNHLTKNKYSSKKDLKKVEAAKKELKLIASSLERFGRSNDSVCALFSFSVGTKSIIEDERLKFSLVSFGTTSPVNSVDMKDLLGPRCEYTTKTIAGKQKLQFLLSNNKPLELENGSKNNEESNPTSWDRPTIKCIPEGARVLSVLVSNRRRENIIKLISLEDTDKEPDEGDDSDLCVYFDKSTNASFRWKRFNTSDSVYIDANSVPATAVPFDNPENLYCVCANTLEVKGGALRAEGLTLLPQGKAFLLLARFTFGLFQQSQVENGAIIEAALAWIGNQVDEAWENTEQRIEKAVEFHQSALDLGETLECFPDKVQQLLDVFDGVDGYEAALWDSLSSNPLIRENMGKHQKQLKEGNVRRFYRRSSTGDLDIGESSSTNSEHEVRYTRGAEAAPPRSKQTKSTKKADESCNSNTNRGGENFSMISLPQAEASEINDLFLVEADNNILGPCEKLAEVLKNYQRATTGKSGKITLEAPDWETYSVQLEDGSKWFKAVFKPDVGYTTKGPQYRAWMKKNDHWTARPRTIRDAISCIPPGQVSAIKKKSMHIASDASQTKHVVFETVQLAVQMEAAFWLERQFGTKKTHWFDNKNVAAMVGQLKGMTSSVKKPTTHAKQAKKPKKKKKTTKVKKSKTAETA